MQTPNFWHKPGVLSYLLSPISWLYWMVVCARTARYQPERMPVPVICIGNNTVGGTGKTPIVIACAKLLKKAGKNPHVISRGYGGTVQEATQVDTQAHSAQDVGDEPLLIAQQAPCWVARRRVDAALAAIAAGADCLLMDDGMQNPTLKKDVTLMVVDGAYGFGNRQLLPAGPAREPLSTSLLKADALVVMGEVSHPDVRSVASLHERVLHAQIKPQGTVPEGALFAFAGIGRPQKFFDTLRDVGATVIGNQSFSDHYAYRQQDLEALLRKAGDAALITTEKDWLRLPSEWQARVHYLPVSAELDDEQALLHILMRGAEPAS